MLFRRGPMSSRRGRVPSLSVGTSAPLISDHGCLLPTGRSFFGEECVAGFLCVQQDC